jgi:hypothetical protein
MLDLRHQYNNCTTIPHMRVGPVCETHPHVRDCCTVVVLVLYKNQIPIFTESGNSRPYKTQCSRDRRARKSRQVSFGWRENEAWQTFVRGSPEGSTRSGVGGCRLGPIDCEGCPVEPQQSSARGPENRCRLAQSNSVPFFVVGD